MAQFRFRRNRVDFDIEGVIYSVPIEKAQNGMRKLGSLQNEAANAASEEEVAACCEKIVKIIDGMTGDGSCARMFGDRNISLIDLCDLIAYMAGEVTAFAAKKQQEYGL